MYSACKRNAVALAAGLVSSTTLIGPAFGGAITDGSGVVTPTVFEVEVQRVQICGGGSCVSLGDDEKTFDIAAFAGSSDEFAPANAATIPSGTYDEVSVEINNVITLEAQRDGVTFSCRTSNTLGGGRGPLEISGQSVYEVEELQNLEPIHLAAGVIGQVINPTNPRIVVDSDSFNVVITQSIAPIVVVDGGTTPQITILFSLNGAVHVEYDGSNCIFSVQPFGITIVQG